MSSPPTRESLPALYQAAALVYAIVDRFDDPSEENTKAAVNISIELHKTALSIS